MIIIFFLLWIILNGRITPEILLLGIPVTALITTFLYKVMGWPLSRERALLRNLPLVLRYILTLAAEIAGSSMAVMALTFSRSRKPEPVITEFHSGLQSDFLNVILANSITLTPGTYTIFQEKDHFVVHCLRKEYADGMGDLAFIRLLGRVK